MVGYDGGGGCGAGVLAGAPGAVPPVGEPAAVLTNFVVVIAAALSGYPRLHRLRLNWLWPGYHDADTRSRAWRAADSMLGVHRCFPITPPPRS